MIKDGLRENTVGAKYLKMANRVCFLESSFYVVEILVKDYKKPEVIEPKAKEKEIQNLD